MSPYGDILCIVQNTKTQRGNNSLFDDIDLLNKKLYYLCKRSKQVGRCSKCNICPKGIDYGDS